MNGFEQAQSEYEYQLSSPYDDLIDWEQYYADEDAYAEMRAEMLMDEIWND